MLQKGFTPLHEAARNGHVRIVEILLKYYDNPDPEGKVSESLYVGIISNKLNGCLYLTYLTYGCLNEDRVQ